MLKNKYSKIAIIIAIIIFALLQRLKILILSPSSIYFLVDYTLSSMIVALFSGFYGPIAGFAIGFLGTFIGSFIFSSFFLWAIISAPYEFLQFGFYGLFIGIFWKKYQFFTKPIGIKSIVFFCIIQIISHLLFLTILINLINNTLSFLGDIWLSIVMNKIIWILPYILFFVIYNRIGRNKHVVQ